MRRASTLHALPVMVIDILGLLRRDHDDLQRGLRDLLDASTPIDDIRTTLDGVRLGLTAHAEAEDIVFFGAIQHVAATPVLEQLIESAREVHRIQESLLGALVCTPLRSALWYRRVVRLRDVVVEQSSFEEVHVLPAIRELAPQAYPVLAGRFATERLRQLSMLQPSAPVYVDLERRAAH